MKKGLAERGLSSSQERESASNYVAFHSLHYSGTALAVLKGTLTTHLFFEEQLRANEFS